MRDSEDQAALPDEPKHNPEVNCLITLDLVWLIMISIRQFPSHDRKLLA